ncbi:unnamed protein product [Cuscuta campestris]|uniref:Retrovirus-related Pol polyprotein from transposon TNT 1-94-like beta-barrel domain-containing protein n=1 Tax=Cuscuta campestris TaxID=132261 RepID=A0A484K1B2_9ASTE|nr:unnamed protein product [Cuscuta campestris]
MSRGRIISLKAQLAKNPRGNRTIEAFIADMTEIASDLALAGSPVSEEDVAVHIMTQLGEDYSAIYQSLRGRNDSFSIGELKTILEDCERELLARASAVSDVIPTANHLQRARGGPSHRGGASGHSRGGQHGGRGPHMHGNRGGRFCNFCQYTSHDTRFCRKLQRFLKDNHVSIGSTSSNHPTANMITSPGGASSVNPQWIVDSGASHHVANDPSSLSTLMDYGGPDEVRLGNGYPHRTACAGSVLLVSMIQAALRIS